MRDEPDIIKEMKLYEKFLLQDNIESYSKSEKSDGENQSTLMKPDPDEKSTGHYHDYKGNNNSFESYDLNPIYKLLIENIFEGLVVLDANAKIKYANESFKQMFSLSLTEDFNNKNFVDFIDKAFRNEFLTNYQKITSNNECFYNTYKGENNKNSSLWIEAIGCNLQSMNQNERIIFIKDVTDQKKKWEKIQDIEKRYKAIADMSADGIITIDPLGKITYVNPSFENMTHKKKNDLLDTLFRNYISEDYVYISQQLFMNTRQSKEMIKNFEMELVTDKSICPIELSISPLYEDDIFAGYVCTIHDITERKTFEYEIRKSERLKTEFMNIAAHELKSPVTPIKGYLELILSDKDVNDKIKKWARISLRNAERLLYLVNDILDVSRLDNDTMKFEMRRINAQELIDEIIEDYKPAIENKNLTLETNVQSPLPHILGDYHRLNQVLKNLFTNAIKFTDQGAIKLSAAILNKELVITLEDSGIGMNEMDVKNIFEKFYQAETCDSRKHEGTGLGLFICKEILKKHNGNISVKSTLGIGSTFTITLPIL